MYQVIIQEHKESNIQIRDNVPSAHAHNLGQNGGFYKVQLVNEFGVIDFEYKG